uniref:Cation/H+ exchanger domain-containing protein n=1 Tax=Panagrolaimus superbus TaxID=310955 RepID=A0A914ZA16_9BILA
MFIIAFGGLRGAIAYGLAVALPDDLPAKNMFVTACIVVIYFTVFLQGMTLKPIANFLEVERKTVHEQKMIEKVYENLIDNTMINIEIILGKRGHHWIRNMYDTFHKSILSPLLIKKQARETMDQSNLVRAAQAMAQQDIAELEEFAHEVTAWYESTRSRTATMTSMDDGNGATVAGVPNGQPQTGTGERARFINTMLNHEPRPRGTSAFAPTSILRRDDVLPEDDIGYEVEPSYDETVSKF